MPWFLLLVFRVTLGVTSFLEPGDNIWVDSFAKDCVEDVCDARFFVDLKVEYGKFCCAKLMMGCAKRFPFLGNDFEFPKGFVMPWWDRWCVGSGCILQEWFLSANVAEVSRLEFGRPGKGSPEYETFKRSCVPGVEEQPHGVRCGRSCDVV